jgi:DNA end-binding protein Ku
MKRLRYSDEVNKAAGYFRDIPDTKPDEELLELAEALIAKKTSAFAAEKFHDHYVEALKELVARKLKLKGGKVTARRSQSLAGRPRSSRDRGSTGRKSFPKSSRQPPRSTSKVR